MKRYHTTLSLLVLLSAMVPPSVLAAGVCKLQQTEQECRDAVRLQVAKEFELDPDELESRAERDVDTLVEEVKDQNAVETFRRLIEKNTGVNSEGLPSSVLDFLSRFGIDVDSGSLGNDQMNLALVLNRFLGLPVDDGYQVRVLLKKAELYAPLAEQIPEATRGERKEALEKGLDDFDNAAFVFTYSPTTQSLGRNHQVHSSEFSALFEGVKSRIEPLTLRYSDRSNKQANLIAPVIQEIDDRLKNAATDAEEQRLGAILSEIEEESYTFESISEFDGKVAAQLLDATQERWRAWYERIVELDKQLEETRFFRFADLVDNQPQVYANVEATARDELVGPDEVKAKLTYEHGFVNVNQLRRHTERCQGLDPKANVLSCYQSYLTAAKLAQLKRGDRFAVSIEVSDVKDYSPTLPDDGISLDIPGDRKIVGSLVYGRYLDFTETGRGQSRVDFSWSYEDVGDDPNRKDRSLLTLTYSQRVAGDMIFAAGVTYANEPEFRGDVDHEISVRAGFTYKLFKDDKF